LIKSRENPINQREGAGSKRKKRYLNHGLKRVNPEENHEEKPEKKPANLFETQTHLILYLHPLLSFPNGKMPLKPFL
jgi:hypothetical protein